MHIYTQNIHIYLYLYICRHETLAHSDGEKRAREIRGIISWGFRGSNQDSPRGSYGRCADVADRGRKRQCQTKAGERGLGPDLRLFDPMS